MWEMQQLGRRAGAVDVDLKSHQPGEMTLLSSSAQGFYEKDAAMFEVKVKRAAPHRLT